MEYEVVEISLDSKTLDVLHKIVELTKLDLNKVINVLLALHIARGTYDGK